MFCAIGHNQSPVLFTEMPGYGHCLLKLALSTSLLSGTKCTRFTLDLSCLSPRGSRVPMEPCPLVPFDEGSDRAQSGCGGWPCPAAHAAPKLPELRLLKACCSRAHADNMHTQSGTLADWLFPSAGSSSSVTAKAPKGVRPHTVSPPEDQNFQILPVSTDVFTLVHALCVPVLFLVQFLNQPH